MQYAEKKILQHEQSQFYGEEIATLTGSDDGVKKSSHIYKLDPKMEGGMIRVGGRLSRSALPQEAKHPIVLPKASRVSDLILSVKVDFRFFLKYSLTTVRGREWEKFFGAFFNHMNFTWLAVVIAYEAMLRALHYKPWWCEEVVFRRVDSVFVWVAEFHFARQSLTLIRRKMQVWRRPPAQRIFPVNTFFIIPNLGNFV